MNKIKKIILFPFTLLKNILVKHNISLNYYIISIAVSLLFTFLLISIVGNNILKHETFVFKKEFIKKNENFTRKAADKIGKYFEDLDTIAIVDLIEKLSKEDNVVYAYVVNSDAEVISHTVKAEMFKKYKDKFVNKENLRRFVNNIKKVWHQEREFKGKDIIKFSKPVVLQFAKDEVIQELSIFEMSESATNQDTEVISTNSNTTASGITNKKQKDDIHKKFYIAGALHIAYSIEKLQMISKFSRDKVRIFYYIAYLLAIILGFFAGKHLEDSISKVDLTLNAILKDKEIDAFKTENRVDTFKKLQLVSNQLIDKFKDYTRGIEDKMDETSSINDLLLNQFINIINEPALITNEFLKAEYINNQALTFLDKEREDIINENLTEAFSNNMNAFDKINNNISPDLDEVKEVKSGKTTFYLVPVNFNNSLKKLIIIMSREGISGLEGEKAEKEKKTEKELRDKGKEKGVEEKKIKEPDKEEDKKEEKKSIRSRLNRI